MAPDAQWPPITDERLLEIWRAPDDQLFGLIGAFMQRMASASVPPSRAHEGARLHVSVRPGRPHGVGRRWRRALPGRGGCRRAPHRPSARARDRREWLARAAGHEVPRPRRRRTAQRSSRPPNSTARISARSPSLPAMARSPPASRRAREPRSRSCSWTSPTTSSSGSRSPSSGIASAASRHRAARRRRPHDRRAARVRPARRPVRRRRRRTRATLAAIPRATVAGPPGSSANLFAHCAGRLGIAGADDPTRS